MSATAEFIRAWRRSEWVKQATEAEKKDAIRRREMHKKLEQIRRQERERWTR